MKKYETLKQRLDDRIKPDLTEYEKVRTEETGCKGCAFFKMNVKCSDMKCQPMVSRPYPIQYRKK